ncbi:hypothetical protein IEQ34_002307 [Dendrobium chrysotoxum]|uniref:Uncharacterized protein n=1 Tax=Dendrobium chrysotoxum TaxID=161865 RepID=A0AAV7HLQ5_DENCH|nr:hypothetical protein IEQ34_002307 [Dendrobium chrysotoxum]
MVKFSCFSTPPVSRSKKVAQRSIGTLQTDYQSAIQDQSIKFVKDSVKSNHLIDNYNSSYNPVKRSTSTYSMRGCWRSDSPNVNIPEDNQEIPQTVLIHKSHSLGSIMEKGSDYSGDDITEDEDIDHGFSYGLLNGWKLKEVPELSDNANSTEVFHHENDRKDYQNQKENDLMKSFDVLTDPMHHETLFTIEVLKQPDRGWHADIAEKAVDDVADFGCASEHIPTLSRSFSVANLRVNKTEYGKNDSRHRSIFRRSRSFSDLNNLNILETEHRSGEKYFDSGVTVEKNVIISRSNLPLHHGVNGKVPWYDDTEVGGLGLVRRKIIKFHDSDGKCLKLKLDMDNKAACNSKGNFNFADALRKSEASNAKITREFQQESSHDNWDQLTPQEFSMRRIENWISQIDIHGDLIVEEQGASSTTVSKEEPQILAAVDPPKSDTRSNLAMEVAYNYISSMTSSSSSAQMANLGLVAVPVLSPFISLRVLNLSGNALVQITPGCLPKFLHMLNLSKNNISTIEGLRDLSRLRVLDLNYNRIARIGHDESKTPKFLEEEVVVVYGFQVILSSNYINGDYGKGSMLEVKIVESLASCSSLKELYLAGNKISEVEGLHRLLKLSTLDLRFNKISTSKGLGQLAANYDSLQAINLEGNPAQKNVGDEQLKKFLLGLLPNLVYYNKQAIRMGSKEVSDRAARAVASPQFDRGLRVEHKHSQRGSHGSDLNLLASNQGQQILATPPPSRKPSKERHVRLQLPPASSKPTKLRSNTGKKPLGVNTNDAMKRS